MFGIWVSPCEDAHTPRLASELDAFYGSKANHVLCTGGAGTAVRILYSAAKGKKNRPSNDGLFFLACATNLDAA